LFDLGRIRSVEVASLEQTAAYLERLERLDHESA
jgi:hypothetical protein